MSEVMEMEETLEGEELLEEELTAEEIFQQHQAEINERFEEKGFFRRMKEMFQGLSMPRNSAEYKLARTELQRLVAPLLAVLLPTLGVITLIVITAITGQTKETIQIDIAKAVEDEAPLEDETPPEEIEPEPVDETVEVVVDTPVVGPVTDVVVPQATPVNEPVSVKPATQDSVAIIKSPVTMRSMTGSRTPGSIGKYTNGGAGYGDKNTEAAVMKALRWFKKKQNKDGSWVSIADTSLIILAYLAHGETPASEEFGETVMKAMQFLIDSQVIKNGQVTFNKIDGHEYTTLIATYALCEAYGMTKNPVCKEAAEKALQRIVDNQSPTGGWDYKLNKASTRDDLSYGGWAIQALKAGKMAGLHPKGLDECIKKAIRCLKTRNFRRGGFNYTAGGGPTGLTATGCLCMQLLGYANQSEVTEALDFMRNWKPGFQAVAKAAKPQGELPGSAPQYYCYYAAQCKYQAGMCEGATAANKKTWVEWNAAMKALYPPSIITLEETIEGVDGKPKQIGYWKGGYHNPYMGTALVALQLMVYYRYLPTTQTKAGKVENHDEAEASQPKAQKAAKDEVDIEVDI
jgi:hypothetical protein